MLDQLIVVGCHMQLSAIVSASECEFAYHVWISRYVDLDEVGRCGDPMLICDGEGDKIGPDVVDESLGGGGVDRCHCPGCCCMCVSRGGRWLYQFGLHNSSRLPSLASLMYAHPLGRPFIRWDERGCWYFNGIFVVFVNESGNLSCQHGDVHMHEVNSGHFSVWWRGWGSDKYRCEWCRYRDGIRGVMSVTVFHGSVALSTVSIIWLVVWVTGIIPVVHLVRFHLSICCRVVRSCSLHHARAVCMLSEGSEGSRMSKDTCGFSKFD